MEKRNFAYYRKASKKNAKAVWKKPLNYFSLLINILMNVFGWIIPFFAPMLGLMNARMTTDAKHKQNIKNTQSCENVTAQNYWKLFACQTIKFAIFFGIALAIVLIGALFGLVGWSFAQMVQRRFYTATLIGCVIPAGVVLALYLIVLPALTIPCAYLIEANPKLEIKEILQLSFSALKGKDKCKLFFNYFLGNLKRALYFVIGYIIILLTAGIGSSKLFGIVGAVLLLVFFIFDPKTVLTMRLFKLNVFADRLNEVYLGTYVISGVSFEEPVTYGKRETESLQKEKAASKFDLSQLFETTKEKFEPLKAKVIKVFRPTPIENIDVKTYDPHDGEPLSEEKTKLQITDEIVEQINEMKAKERGTTVDSQDNKTSEEPVPEEHAEDVVDAPSTELEDKTLEETPDEKPVTEEEPTSTNETPLAEYVVEEKKPTTKESKAKKTKSAKNEPAPEIEETPDEPEVTSENTEKEEG